MKRTAAILLTAALTVSLCACGGNSDTSSAQSDQEVQSGQTSQSDPGSMVTQVQNPVYEVTKEELASMSGIDLAAPEEAENVRYSYIEMGEEPPIAQVDFQMNGADAFLRAQTSQVDQLIDISGLYYKWNQTKDCQIGAYDGTVSVNQREKVGYVSWLDTDAGIIYNLGMTKDASADALVDLSNTIANNG